MAPTRRIELASGHCTFGQAYLWAVAHLALCTVAYAPVPRSFSFRKREGWMNRGPRSSEKTTCEWAREADELVMSDHEAEGCLKQHAVMRTNLSVRTNLRRVVDELVCKCLLV